MGLGLIPEVIVDQHFHNRNRMARLMSAISGYPERLGIRLKLLFLKTKQKMKQIVNNRESLRV